MSKRNVVITGLGFITSIGNDRETVADSLINLKNGIEKTGHIPRNTGSAATC